MNPPILKDDGPWQRSDVPPNVRCGDDVMITGRFAFKRFRTRHDPGLIIGSHCTMDGVQFALGPDGKAEIGEYCYFTNAVLLCELELKIGNFVAIGWNSVITDSDFHP